MIAVKDKFPKLTPEEYFIGEEQQLLRHEYLSGRVRVFPNYRHILGILQRFQIEV